MPELSRYLRRWVVAVGVGWPIWGRAKNRDAKSPDASVRRLDFAASVDRLKALHLLAAGEFPRLPDHSPRIDEPSVGVSFFRTEVRGLDLADLSLPRTLFGRSDVNTTSFRNTDLSESNLCWNDFTGVDFSQADLSGSDLRSSIFERVAFRGTNLRRADMRHAQFFHCDFRDADMHGAVLSRAVATALMLSAAQRALLDIRADNGPEPEGG